MLMYECSGRISILISCKICLMLATGWFYVVIHIRHMIIFRSGLTEGCDGGIRIIFTIFGKSTFIDIVILVMSTGFALDNVEFNVFQKLISNQRLFGDLHVIFRGSFLLDVVVIYIRDFILIDRHISWVNIPCNDVLCCGIATYPKMKIGIYARIIIRIKMYGFNRVITMSCIPPLVNVIGIGQNGSSNKFRIQRTRNFCGCLFHSTVCPGFIRIKVITAALHIIDDVPDYNLSRCEVSVLLPGCLVIGIDYGTN